MFKQRVGLILFSPVFFLIFGGASISSRAATPPLDLTGYDQIRYVSASTGSNATGEGTIDSPWASVSSAIYRLEDASEDNLYAFLVASGTDANDFPPILMKPWIHLYGGFDPTTWERGTAKHKTILLGKPGKPILRGADHIVLDGLIIRDARPGLSDTNPPIKSGGGGIKFRSVSSVLVSNCTITHNEAGSAYQDAGGVSCIDSRVTFADCIFSENRTGKNGGGVYGQDSDLEFVRCVFKGNSSTNGAGVFLLSSVASLQECDFVDNESITGGGGLCSHRSSSEVTRCRFTHNEAFVGGAAGIFYDSSCFFSNCLVISNTALGEGGGLALSGDSFHRLTNCTIARNKASVGSGGVQSYGSAYSLVNCILWGNEPNGINLVDATPSVAYSVAQGGLPGIGNVDADPMFVDPENGDFRLQQGSVCIDSGSPEFGRGLPPRFLVHGDFDGWVRIWDGDGDGQPRVDMGAFEFGSSAKVGDLTSDSGIDALDLFIAQSVWGPPTGVGTVYGDQNGDNRFNARDLLILEYAWRKLD